MKIVLTGGGTGGHISPILAVAQELRCSSSVGNLFYIGERNGKFSSMTAEGQLFDKTFKIFAGKFRRYSGESFWKKITDVHTILLNFRDSIYVILGIIQATFLLLKIRPNVVFAKGGYVGVPVGLAAALLRIPIVTHDSDSTPGMANKIIGRFAKIHAVGMKGEYGYKTGETIFTGIPVNTKYQLVDKKQQNEFKRLINIPEQSNLLVITGGSQGAGFINHLVEELIDKLFVKNKDLYIVHQKGHRHINTNEKTYPKQISKAFFDDMYKYTGAADVIIARCGASTIAEISLQKKPLIVIPARLAGDHQTKNAKILENNQAAVVLSEKILKNRPELLVDSVVNILNDKKVADNLSSRLNKMSEPNSATILAGLIISTAKK